MLAAGQVVCGYWAEIHLLCLQQARKCRVLGRNRPIIGDKVPKPLHNSVDCALWATYYACSRLELLGQGYL